nr:MAG TPA: hypothetical protein [Caudoviricetes sp.]
MIFNRLSVNNGLFTLFLIVYSITILSQKYIQYILL